MSEEKVLTKEIAEQSTLGPEILCDFQKFENFEEFYGEILRKFRSWGRLQEIRGKCYKTLGWPEGIGVYLIRKVSDGEVVYVGMTGKIIRSPDGEVELKDKKDGFKKRSQRYTPYCFTESGAFKDHFEYGPNFKGDDFKKKLEKDRYKKHIPIRDLSVDCFVLGKGSTIAPAFLESLVLQAYFTHKGTLPDGNNQL